MDDAFASALTSTHSFADDYDEDAHASALTSTHSFAGDYESETALVHASGPERSFENDYEEDARNFEGDYERSMDDARASALTSTHSFADDYDEDAHASALTSTHSFADDYDKDAHASALASAHSAGAYESETALVRASGPAHSFENDYEEDARNADRDSIHMEENEQLHMQLEKEQSEVAKLRNELSYVEFEAASLGARYLSGGEEHEAAKRDPKLQQLLADAQASKHINVKDEVFLEHFLVHIARPNAPYCQLIADIASHYANVLGEHKRAFVCTKLYR